MERSKLFISYSRKDKDVLDRLRVHLKPLERQNRLELWDDSKIDVGADWKASIEDAINSAAAAILLISADFVASDFIVKHEVEPLLKAARQGLVKLLPVMVSACDIEHSFPDLGDLQFFGDLKTCVRDLDKSAQEKFWDALGTRSSDIVNQSKGAFLNIRPNSSTALNTPSLTFQSLDADGLTTALEERFGIVWEPGNADRSTSCVFWPVRLRHPTLIHAQQAFIAAAYQLKGAKVILCLDDFGNAASPTPFLTRMAKHFRFVGGKWDEVAVEFAKNVITKGKLENTWEILAQWLSPERAKLGTVLRVCKLLMENADEDMRAILEKKSRRLMTPAVIWSCFDEVLRSFPDRSFCTLGGHDERDFWKVWRDFFARDSKVAHLYGPALNKIVLGEQGTNKALAMADLATERVLKWASRSDIEDALKGDGGSAIDTTRILGWLTMQCLLLPYWLRGVELSICGQSVSSRDGLEVLNTQQRSRILTDVATKAAEVLVQN